MLRFRRQLFAVLCAGALAAAAPRAGAQQTSASRSVTVKKGDTLWDLARQLLGDPYLWPEIYRVNTSLIEDPHWIYPGEILRLPGSTETAAPVAPVAQIEKETPAPAEPREQRGMTIFNPLARPVAKRPHASLLLLARSTAVRPGEFLASPFMWAVGGPPDGGRVELTAETHGIEMTLENRPIQIRENVFLRPPKGARGDVGERFLTYRLGDVVEGQGQVVIPTGVARVSSAAKDGIVQAELLQKFEDVFTGQGAIGLDTLSMPLNKFPLRVEFGRVTTVAWTYNHPVLPTNGHYLILAAGAKDGLVVGDQVSLLREHHDGVGGALLSQEEVAVAQVTRVTPWGASAIIIKQQQVGIVEGMDARISAKMP